MDINFALFSEELEKEIISYSLTNKIPITNLSWEERVVNALVGSGINLSDIEWKPGSHRSGRDIMVYNYGFSCKSMTTDDNGIAALSSFRTTTFNTLAEKIEFIDNGGKNFSHYLVIARRELVNHLRYKTYMIDANYIQASEFDWTETFGKQRHNHGTSTGWETGYRNGLRLKIARKMSDQLWIYLDTDRLHNAGGVRVLTENLIKYDQIGYYWNEVRGHILNVRDEQNT